MKNFKILIGVSFLLFTLACANEPAKGDTNVTITPKEETTNEKQNIEVKVKKEGVEVKYEKQD